MSDRPSLRAQSQLACHAKEERKGLISVRGGAKIMIARTGMERCRWCSHHWGAGSPVADGRLLLGTWQGLYLWEHRHAPHSRSLIVTVMGEA
jgi:hypothetical protein